MGDRPPGKGTSVAGRPWTTTIADAVQERLPGPVAAVVRRLRSEDVSLLSAGLSFYALVSVVPFAVLVLWLVSLITGKARVREVAEQLARHLPAKLGVDNALQRVADLGVGLGVGALAALVWPASAYGAGLRRSFARLADNQDEDVKGLRGRGLALGLVGVVPALALAGLVAAYLGTAVVGDGGAALVAGWVLALAFGFVASAVSVAVIYRLFAPTSLGWQSIARGAVAAGGAISVVSLGYVIFLNSGVDFERRYATSGLAAVVLLAVWLFVTNALILVGFEIAQELRAREGTPTGGASGDRGGRLGGDRDGARPAIRNRGIFASSAEPSQRQVASWRRYGWRGRPRRLCLLPWQQRWRS
ncbi:MAG: YihY/virulence factor BrkB family protein [Actinomycetota bacterium]|nr:YihY/virulence factor BrkB family protein [Actinomycetota bacterium]